MLNPNDETLRKRYEALCNELSLDGTYTEKAWNEYQRLILRYSFEGDPLHWLTCILFITYRSGKLGRNQGSNVSLSQMSLSGLLKAAELSVLRFFELLHRLEEIFSECTETRSELSRLESSFHVSSVLIHKFPAVFSLVFQPESPAFETTQNFTWLIFLWAKARLLSVCTDLVAAFHLLLAVHELLFQSVISAKLFDLLQPAIESSTTDILALLSTRFHGIMSEARSVFAHSLQPAVRRLADEEALRLPLVLNIPYNSRIFSRQYDLLLIKHFALDERQLLCESSASSSLLPRTPLTCSNLIKPLNPSTPISQATTAFLRLQSLLSSYPATMKNLHNLISEDNILLLKDLFKEMKSIPEYAEAEKLTFVALDLLLLREQHHRDLDLSFLLFQTHFPMSLFDCCVHVVLFCHHYPRPPEPSKYLTHPYFFYRVIEPFIRALLQIGLSRDIVKYLSTVEERILECKIFQSDSPLWKRIEENEASLPLASDILPTSTDQPISSVDSRFNSPLVESARRQLFPTTAAAAAGAAALSSNESPHSTLKKVISIEQSRWGSLGLFFRKLYHLAGVRLHDLCVNKLEQADILCRRVWSLLEHVLSSEITILKDRHLDQIIMCSVYAMAKATKAVIPFQNIMREYRGQPQADTHVYRDVLLENGQHGDIIQFYNDIFVPKFKSFICDFLHNTIHTGLDRNLPAVPKPHRNQITESPLKLSPRYSVFLSPRKIINSQSQSSSPLLYCFNKSPSKELTAINTALKNSSKLCIAAKKRRINSAESESCNEQPHQKIFCSSILHDKLQLIKVERNSSDQEM